MNQIPRPQEIYKHFKGNLYQIVTIAQHTETDEPMVVYQAMYGDFKVYVRPLAMFMSPVDKEKYPSVAQEYRFELQGLANVSDAEKCTGLLENSTAAERKVPVESQTAELEGKPQDVGLQEQATQEQATQQQELQEQERQTQQIQSEEQELDLDPLLLQFLDADTYAERLNILAGLHHRITDEMITTMAIACDIEVDEGNTQERYESLKNCLVTLEKYECNRLR